MNVEKQNELVKELENSEYVTNVDNVREGFLRFSIDETVSFKIPAYPNWYVDSVGYLPDNVIIRMKFVK